jgi:hypothetical protein
MSSARSANYTESFKEVKIDMASNSAESPSLGQVPIVSKSGTNRFAGVVFDYYQSPMFRAPNPFSGRRPAGVLHFPGLAVGGPAVIPRLYDGRGRTFWFVSGETVNGSKASTDLNPTVPLEPWRRGDFSALGRPIRNPFTGEVYADGRIPAAALNPIARRIQERFYPLPNTGNTAVLAANNYRETVPNDRSKPYYARLGQRARIESLALWTAQEIPFERSPTRPHVPDRADHDEHLQRAPVGESEPERDADQCERRSHQRSRRHLGFHSAGRHAPDAAGSPRGVVN